MEHWADMVDCVQLAFVHLTDGSFNTNMILLTLFFLLLFIFFPCRFCWSLSWMTVPNTKSAFPVKFTRCIQLSTGFTIQPITSICHFCVVRSTVFFVSFAFVLLCFFFFVFLFIPLLFSFLSHILIRLQCIRLVVVFAFQHSCCWDIEQIPVDRHSLELRIDRHWEGIRKITSLPNRGGRERERENTPGFTFVNLWICQIWTVFVSLFSSTKSVCGDARARVSMLCEWQRRQSNGKRCIMIFS